MPTVAEYEQWCGDVVQSVGNRVTYYGIWNEPNHGDFKLDPSSRAANAAAYRDLYLACRARIKLADPTAKVFFGEISTPDPGPCGFMDEAINGSAPIPAEGVAIHTYQMDTNPDYVTPGDVCRGIGGLSSWQGMLAGNQHRIRVPGGGIPELFITEHGYCQPEGECPREAGRAHSRDEGTRAAWLARSYDKAEENGIGAFNLYHVSKTTNAAAVTDWDSGIVEPDGFASPSAPALRQAVGLPAALPPNPRPPSATTDPASGVGETGATLNGTVNPHGLSTTYRFEYGRTTSYGSSIPVPAGSAGAGNGSVSVNAAVGGLLHDTTYHYRLVATNTIGTTYGEDRSFQTAPASGLLEFMWPVGADGWRAYDLVVAAPQPPIAGAPSAVTRDGFIRLYSRSTDGHLIETINDYLGGRIWNAYDLTGLTGGSWATIADDPTVAVVDGLARIYAHRSNGRLLEWVHGADGWGVYDLTQVAGAPATVGRPSVLVIDGLPHVYARSQTGGLIEFSWSPAGRLTWANLTGLTGAPAPAGDPTAVLVDGLPHVYTPTATGHLVETVYGRRSDGSWGWLAFDLTSLTGGPPLAGDPQATLVGGLPRAYAISTQGRLVETVYGRRSDGSWGWLAFDLTSLTGVPPLVGAPAVVVADGLPRVYARSDANRLSRRCMGRWAASGGGRATTCPPTQTARRSAAARARRCSTATHASTRAGASRRSWSEGSPARGRRHGARVRTLAII